MRDPDGILIATRVGPTTTPASPTSYYPFTDQLGSVRTMVTTTTTTTTTGTGTVAAAYSAYGATKTATGPQAAANPYRYGQGYADSSTGLIKLGARYYDPTHGRFTQTDPSGQNPHYLYTADNPITYLDPSGLDWCDFAALFIGIAGIPIALKAPVRAAGAAFAVGAAAVTVYDQAYNCGGPIPDTNYGPSEPQIDRYGCYISSFNGSYVC